MDWYGILGVNPFADEETVRKQYRKLALTLHPDKNKSLGAEGAFRLVSEAWSSLSEKVAHNQNWSSGGFHHNAPNNVESQSEAPRSNGFYNLNKNATSSVRAGNNNARENSTSIPPKPRNAGTFWTVCNRCWTHYEYLRIYLNHTLLCPNCNEAFMATERGPPPNVGKHSQKSSRQQPNSGRNHSVNPPNSGRNHPVNPGRTSAVSQNVKSGGSTGMSSFSNTNFQWTPHSTMAGFGSTDRSSSAAAASVKQQSSETRREYGGGPSVATWERSHMYKRSDGSFSNVENPSKKMRSDDIHTYMRDGSSSFSRFYESGKANMGTERTHGFSGIAKHNSMRELTVYEIRNMLIDKAKTEIRKKLQEWRSMAYKARQKSTSVHKTIGLEKRGGSAINGNRQVDTGSLPVASDDIVNKNPAFVTINVPDPDFHNFDLDRSENSFEEDQVWAAYDDDDGMPRYYARIHKVRWTKGTRGVVRIFPGKGEIWALYHNWSPNWNAKTPDEVIHKYDMVEVLEDFNEEEGVLVTPLVKVDGFRTVFQRQSHNQVRKIPKAEIFRFSHQVPNYLLTGQEAQNAPKGCHELDPAATPLDLLQTATEASDNIGKSKEDTLPSSPEKHASGKGENSSEPSRAIEQIC
ncbi:hypothetical protein RJT34_16398 [Clitoria ternatea]|uniref:J domain-containing protein n=1 Tax=Clitoria ternatea TaxID=43366 RepID=A0AAN9J740_CLITE